MEQDRFFSFRRLLRVAAGVAFFGATLTGYQAYDYQERATAAEQAGNYEAADIAGDASVGNIGQGISLLAGGIILLAVADRQKEAASAEQAVQ